MIYLRSACLSLITALSVVHFIAQAAPPKPPDQPKAEVKLTAPPSKEKDALYVAIHKKDTADKAVSDLSLRVAQIQQQAQQQFAQLDAQQKAADKAVAVAEAALLKEMKLDPEKWTLNLETMEATAKPETPKTAEPKK